MRVAPPRPNTDYNLSSTVTSCASVSASKPRPTSTRRRLLNNTVRVTAGSTPVHEATVAATSTATRRRGSSAFPSAAFCLFCCFFKCRFSVLNAIPWLRQNSLLSRPLARYKTTRRSISDRPRRRTATPDSALMTRVHHKPAAINRCVPPTLTLNVTRSIWHQVVGNCKTEASAKPVPMDSYLAEDLLRWRRQSIYSANDDYVFASETIRGKQPYWPDNLMKRHIRPVAKANGIHKKIGWHTFRHSFGTLLKANGEDVKTVQELLRHANSRITLDVYTQAVNSNKRAAQSKVVKMMVSSVGTKVAGVGTSDSEKIGRASCRE